MGKINLNWIIIGADIKPVSEERRTEVLMNMSRKLKLMKKAATVQKYPESYLEEITKLIADIDEELLTLVPKIPEYKL